MVLRFIQSVRLFKVCLGEDEVALLEQSDSQRDSALGGGEVDPAVLLGESEELLS